ncbi:hypothetical protein BUALT_Bualt07G0051600 [Buddleja alternifolia]|uniref:Uncharacterized protein n=1 Tax=Buddleja alternifolia TaxID=168488 RepID=A0AAV6X8D6_9LAMI|nr:hypothetical protein BUALT_Bualt07G0051600 [Buddleja alternifolia]
MERVASDFQRWSNLPQLFLDNVANISSRDDDDSMFIVKNGGVLFGPVIQSLLVPGMHAGEDKDPVNAPFLQAVPLINVSSDDTLSSETTSGMVCLRSGQVTRL